MKQSLYRFAFVVHRIAYRRWEAHLADDNTIVAFGDTRFEAIAALCALLDEEDARLDAEQNGSRS